MEDEPVQKPRRMRGTPTFSFSLKVGAAISAGCFALHFLQWYFMKDRVYRKIASGYYDTSEHIKKRRKVMSNLSPIPHTRSGPISEWEEMSTSIHDDAQNCLDVDI